VQACMWLCVFVYMFVYTLEVSPDSYTWLSGAVPHVTQSNCMCSSDLNSWLYILTGCKVHHICLSVQHANIILCYCLTLQWADSVLCCHLTLQWADSVVCCHLFTGCMFCSALSWPGCQMKWTTTAWLSFPCWSECRTPKVGTDANIKMHLVNVSWSPHWSIHSNNLHTFTNSVLCCLSCCSSEAVVRSFWLELCYKLRRVKFQLVSIPEHVHVC